jgi:hypothetical protein
LPDPAELGRIEAMLQEGADAEIIAAALCAIYLGDVVV